MSKIVDWSKFSVLVHNHIRDYTIPQYGDTGEDIATDYTYEECINNIKRYLARAGRNSRPGQDELDCIKIAHYAQMAYDKLRQQKEKNNDN